MEAYRAELRIPQHPVSLRAVQGFFGAVADEMGLGKRIRYDVELAVEEGLGYFFAHAKSRDLQEPLRVTLEVGFDALRITVRTPGRPYDFQHLPTYSTEGAEEKNLEGLGPFLLQSVMDSVQWRYVEKEGQELVMVKRLPSPVVASQGPLDPQGTADHIPVTGRMAFRLLQTEEEAFAVAASAYDIYRYAYKDVIYYPQEVLARNRSGQMRSWIAIDEAGTVFGHYAMMKKKPDDLIAEMGAAFVRPEARTLGLFHTLTDLAHADAYASPLRGLFSLSVTNHLSTQKSSERAGRFSVGLRIASSPAIFVEGARPGDRITTVLNYRQLAPREPRRLYLPPRYGDLIRSTYELLKMPAPREEGPGDHAAPEGGNTLECAKDLTWNRAVLEARGGEEARYKLRAYTEILLEQNIACIVLSLDLEDPGTPALVEEAVSLGFFYSGLMPESLKGGHDALQMQLLNQIQVDLEGILLHQPMAKIIMEHIRTEAPQIFCAAPRREGQGVAPERQRAHGPHHQDTP